MNGIMNDLKAPFIINLGDGDKEKDFKKGE